MTTRAGLELRGADERAGFATIGDFAGDLREHAKLQAEQLNRRAIGRKDD